MPLKLHFAIVDQQVNTADPVVRWRFASHISNDKIKVAVTVEIAGFYVTRERDRGELVFFPAGPLDLNPGNHVPLEITHQHIFLSIAIEVDHLHISYPVDVFW